MRFIRNKIVLISLLILSGMYLNAQQNSDFKLYEHPKQSGGFDASGFSSTSLSIGSFPVYHKSVWVNEQDFVFLGIRKTKKINFDSLQFAINNQVVKLKKININDTLLTLVLPPKKNNYSLYIVQKNKTVLKLLVSVYQRIKKKVYIIPLLSAQINTDSLELSLNKRYAAAGVRLSIQFEPMTSILFEKVEIFDKPSSNFDRYTLQMQSLRDTYFSKKGKIDRNAFYVFLVPEFSADSNSFFAVQNKAISFVCVDNERMNYSDFHHALAIGLGAGIEQDSVRSFTFEQWKHVRQQIYTFSMFDPYENIRSSSGRVAYFFWETNKDGSIKTIDNEWFSSIIRPFKKNYNSYHLNITVFWFKPLFYIKTYSVNLLHLLMLFIVFGSAIYYRIKLHRFIKLRFRRSFLLRLFSRVSIFLVATGIAVLLYIIVNFGYRIFEIDEGRLVELKNKNIKRVVDTISKNSHNTRKDVNHLASEVLIKKGRNWNKHHLKSVLYFSIQQNNQSPVKLFFLGTSDTVKLRKTAFKSHAKNHYIVLNTFNNKRLIKQQLFNYSGVELTDKIKLKDPASRVLVFVNGYRPTVFGADFEETFAAIQQKGLEFPNSENLLFDFDRYDYWQPWNNIAGLFQKRINPSTVLYADGHFSVTTSNYKNMLAFTNVSSRYPKRCSYPQKHHCYYTITARSKIFGGNKKEKTLDLLPIKSNKKGFDLRYQNGKIAGLNLIQKLNEIPNKSQNDTLFIVAHSMGYAYSLGMIDVLRGHIQFGGFYILAPENAIGGKVNISEWNEVWQYGSRLSFKTEAPCMQDGVAPQQLVSGLKSQYHASFPINTYLHRGFFNSHFVGFYTWIFDLSKNEIGFIKQR